MSVGTRLGLFAVILAASFGVGAALGAATPDLGPDEPVEHDQEQEHR